MGIGMVRADHMLGCKSFRYVQGREPAQFRSAGWHRDCARSLWVRDPQTQTHNYCEFPGSVRDAGQSVLLSSVRRRRHLKVNRKSTPAIPEAILQLQRQLDQFRSTQPPRTKLPE